MLVSFRYFCIAVEGEDDFTRGWSLVERVAVFAAGAKETSGYMGHVVGIKSESRGLDTLVSASCGGHSTAREPC